VCAVDRNLSNNSLLNLTLRDTRRFVVIFTLHHCPAGSSEYFTGPRLVPASGYCFGARHVHVRLSVRLSVSPSLESV